MIPQTKHDVPPTKHEVSLLFTKMNSTGQHIKSYEDRFSLQDHLLIDKITP